MPSKVSVQVMEPEIDGVVVDGLRHTDYCEQIFEDFADGILRVHRFFFLL
jgi:hypothetical protein